MLCDLCAYTLFSLWLDKKIVIDHCSLLTTKSTKGTLRALRVIIQPDFYTSSVKSLPAKHPQTTLVLILICILNEQSRTILIKAYPCLQASSLLYPLCSLWLFFFVLCG